MEGEPKMKKLIVVTAVVMGTLFLASEAFAQVKWVSAPQTSNGGYFRDTSNDGNPYNNANYLGWNN